MPPSPKGPSSVDLDESLLPSAGPCPPASVEGTSSSSCRILTASSYDHVHQAHLPPKPRYTFRVPSLPSLTVTKCPGDQPARTTGSLVTTSLCNSPPESPFMRLQTVSEAFGIFTTFTLLPFSIQSPTLAPVDFPPVTFKTYLNNYTKKSEFTHMFSLQANAYPVNSPKLVTFHLDNNFAAPRTHIAIKTPPKFLAGLDFSWFPSSNLHFEIFSLTHSNLQLVPWQSLLSRCESSKISLHVSTTTESWELLKKDFSALPFFTTHSISLISSPSLFPFRRGPCSLHPT